MTQYRLLHSSISTSKKIKNVKGDKWFRVGCHLVYTWLLPWCDDDGRMRGESLFILANVLPNENLSQKEIELMLIELDRVDLLKWYEIDEEKYIQIVDFESHQRIRKDRYKPSSYPCQPIDNQKTTSCGESVFVTGVGVGVGDGNEYKPTGRQPKPKKKEFIPPKIEDVKLFFKENGYKENSGEEAFKYYHEADWHDSKGNKVKNWKQKMRGVWFRDENKDSKSKEQSDSTYSNMTGSNINRVKLWEAERILKESGQDKFKEYCDREKLTPAERQSVVERVGE